MAIQDLEFRGVHDGRMPSRALEEPLVEHELRIKELSARVVVDDCDGLEACVAANALPLGGEVASDVRREFVQRDASGGEPRKRGRHLVAARGERAGEFHVHQQPTRIGIDLDELWIGRPEVEIESQQCAARVSIHACDLRGVPCHVSRVGGAHQCAMDQGNRRVHRGGVLRIDEHDAPGREPRPLVEQQARIAGGQVQLRP